MKWVKSEKYPSGMTLWQLNEKSTYYPDLSIHVFDEREGYTVSFDRHQVSRFKSVEDAINFADNLIANRVAAEEKTNMKIEKSAKRSKRNADNMDNV